MSIIKIADYNLVEKAQKSQMNLDKEHKNQGVIDFLNKVYKDRDFKRKELKKKFPYSVILEGCYEAHELVAKWCWENIGNFDGECKEGAMSCSVGCPIVKSTQHIVSGEYPDATGKQIHLEYIAYSDVDDHSHKGIWSSCWLLKNGYDAGFEEYFFLTEVDKRVLVEQVPNFNWNMRVSVNE